MARTVPTSLTTASRALHSAGRWIWLAEIASQNAGQFYRLCSGRRPVQFGSIIYQAGIASIVLPGADVDASTGEATLVVPNASLIPQAIIDVEGDQLGQSVTLRLVHDSAPTETGALTWTFRVLRAELDPNRCSLVLGHAADIDEVPGPSFDRTRFPTLVRARVTV